MSPPLESLGETVADVPTDFIGSSDNAVLGSSEAGETSALTIDKTFVCTQDQVPGVQVFTFDLDRHIDEKIFSISKRFEQYCIQGLSLEFAPTSPLGTSSGAIQVAYIADPVNAMLTSDYNLNLQKVVRQAGSLLVRPRESVTLKCPTANFAYCLESSDPRFSSHGSIVGIIRETPSAGDEIKFSVTLRCTYRFITATINNEVTTFRDNIILTPHSVDAFGITFGVPEVPIFEEMKIVPHRPNYCIRYNKYLKKVNASGLRLKASRLLHLTEFVAHLMEDTSYIRVDLRQFKDFDCMLDLEFLTLEKVACKVSGKLPTLT